MSENFGERFYYLLNDLEDWVVRGYRVDHDSFQALPPTGTTGRGAPDSEATASEGRFAPGSAKGRPAAGESRPAGADGDAVGGGPAPASDEARQKRLEELAELIRVCSRCPLQEGRTHAVPGQGVLDPLIMVIGEGPGAEEDRLGLPFVGPAGQYLDKWLSAIGIYREKNAYIANIVKCRPPNNRDPESNEADACLPYLREQIELVRPRAILTVGRVAFRFLTGEAEGIGRVHGKLYEYQGLPLMPTYHPSGVLRNPEYRRPVWEDLKKLRDQVLRLDG